jgi:hypothetical protein
MSIAADVTTRVYALFRLGGVMVALSLLAGCGTLYELDISAKNPEQTLLEGTYVLVPSDPLDLLGSNFVNYSGQIERALSGTQLRRLPIDQIDKADMAIVVEYAVSDPESVGYTSKVPMFQQARQPPSEADANSGAGGGGSNRSPAAQADTSEPPRQDQLTGTHEYTFVRTGYWRDLSLRAITFDWNASETPSIKKTGYLWSVTVATYGSSPDMDEVFPVMAAAAKPYIGSHNEDLISEKMNGIDKRIKEIQPGN